MLSDRKQQFMNIAHRGFSAQYPENTLLAFKKALGTGVKWVEFDVHLSSDGVPVVIHDDTVDRTTDGTGRVGDLALEDIRGLDAGTYRGEEFAGERVPTLDEVLEFLNGQSKMAIELKGEGEALVTSTMEAVARAVGRNSVGRNSMSNIVTYSSFRRENMTLARATMPESSLNPLVHLAGRSVGQAVDDALDLGATTLGMKAADTTVELVEAAHKAGLLVRCWGAAGDTGPEIRRLIDIGADGLTTNHPDVLMRILEAEGIDPH